MAVAQSIMVSVFHMLTRRELYHEWEAHYFDARRWHYTVDRLAQRIERLGYRVHLEPVAEIAAREIFKAPPTLSDGHHHGRRVRIYDSRDLIGRDSQSIDEIPLGPEVSTQHRYEDSLDPYLWPNIIFDQYQST